MVLPQLRLEAPCLGVCSCRGLVPRGWITLTIGYFVVVAPPAAKRNTCKTKTHTTYAPHLRSGQKPTRADQSGRSQIVVLYTGRAKLKFAAALGLHELL